MIEQYIPVYNLQSGGGSVETPLYTRPADWISIPSISSGEEVIYLLIAVFEDNNANYIAFNVEGDYTVDWGDGNTANFSSGVNAEHQYDYANVSNPSTQGEGYRQALIKITPQSGQNLTLMDFQIVHSDINSGKCYNILDIVISAPNLTTLTIHFKSGTEINLNFCERIWFYDISSVTSFLLFCFNMFGLRQVIFENDPDHITQWRQAFNNCVKLIDVQFPNNIWKLNSGLTNLTIDRAFNNTNISNDGLTIDLNGNTFNSFGNALRATSLKSFEFINGSFSNLGNLDFSSTNLIQIPDIDYSNISNFNSTFRNCPFLEGVDNTHDFSSATTFNICFYDAVNMRYFHNFTTTSVTDFRFMFRQGTQDSSPLRSIKFDATSLTSAGNISNFAGWDNLEELIIQNLGVSLNVSNCNLSAEAIDEFGNSVKDLTGLASATITLTGNPGTGAMTDAIWTNKNWTIVK